MGGVKKVLAGAALAVVIVVAIVFAVKGARKGAPKPPAFVMDYDVERVDQESHKVITLSGRKWEELGAKDGKYKNPDTGKYTMVLSMLCASCGGKIPAHEVYANSSLQTPENWAKAYNEYMCPLCGKHALPPPRPVPTGGPPSAHPPAR